MYEVHTEFWVEWYYFGGTELGERILVRNLYERILGGGSGH